MEFPPHIIARVLTQLRDWGWEAGLERLKTDIAATAQPDERAALQLCVGWMAGERGTYAEALAQCQAAEQHPAWTALALVGQAFVAMRQHDYPHAHALLEQAATQGDPTDALLRAAIAHCRGAVLFHEGGVHTEVLAALYDALELFGREHFGTGRVLDTLGMVYASRDNFYAAGEFYRHALTSKKRFDDDAGLALTHGQLGRLYLDWGNLDAAAQHFTTDLHIAQHIGDTFGVALMHNFLGQVALARRAWQDAAHWLDECIRLSQAGGWTALTGFAQKDRALAWLGRGRVAEAEAAAGIAESLLTHPEGRAHVQRVWGLVRRKQRRYEEAEDALQAALRWFDDYHERAEAARTQLEIARTLRSRRASKRLRTQALLDALDRAERCCRDVLVREIEAELTQIDAASYCSHIYHRARGRGIHADTVSLRTGSREEATVMFLDLQGSTDYVRSTDPEVVMLTLNQMMADLATVLEHHAVTVNQYLGDGFMALVRGADHAQRAVVAALEAVQVLQAFNRPRQVLQMPLLRARIGISTGGVVFGNVGTY
jgi:tetratricopeptide (TPR) repeat protein